MLDTTLTHWGNSVMLPIASQFLEYADRDYRESSPLYAFVAIHVAQDSELLEIASHGKITVPNLFFAAVQYLLMHSNNEPLAEYYPNFHTTVKPLEEVFPVFRSFCLRHQQEIIDIISSRIVQTNEVSRCAYLYPAFSAVAKMEGNRPLAMIDIGTSAGLHLLVRYGDLRASGFAPRYENFAVHYAEGSSAVRGVCGSGCAGQNQARRQHDSRGLDVLALG